MGSRVPRPANGSRCHRLQQVLFFLAALCACGTAAAPAAAKPRYTAQTIGDVVQLGDGGTDTVVSVLTAVANAYEMVAKGHNVFRMTIQSVDAMRANPGLNGIPLLAPFANRLDGTYFFANGRKYNFDLENGTVRGPVPIHGYLASATGWKVVEAKADANGAWITERLDFYRNPLFMQNFPFAQVITRTYRLSRGALEVRLRIDNLADEPMPLSVGYHPFYSLSDSNRKEWTLSVPARTHWLLNDAKLPTGRTEPADAFWGGDRHAVALARFETRTIDDLFSDLERDKDGRATVHLQGKEQGLSVVIGPKFNALVLYSPATSGTGGPPSPPRTQANPPPPVSKGPPIPLSALREVVPPQRGTIAIEPMAGITNAMNLAQAGTYKELQSIPARGSWTESFWLVPTSY